jgi:hypothetical protein
MYFYVLGGFLFLFGGFVFAALGFEFNASCLLGRCFYHLSHSVSPYVFLKMEYNTVIST